MHNSLMTLSSTMSEQLEEMQQRLSGMEDNMRISSMVNIPDGVIVMTAKPAESHYRIQTEKCKNNMPGVGNTVFLM